MLKDKKNKTKTKANIPKALREQVWLKNMGHQYEHKCLIDWCQNTISVFDFHVGHNIPESHGGKTDITNLKPICSRCNLSMGSQYSIAEWIRIGDTPPRKSNKLIYDVDVKNDRVKLPWYTSCLPCLTH
jgi:5-methylcytosine-specific restriction endonuclease McrA